MQLVSVVRPNHSLIGHALCCYYITTRRCSSPGSPRKEPRHKSRRFHGPRRRAEAVPEEQEMAMAIVLPYVLPMITEIRLRFTYQLVLRFLAQVAVKTSLDSDNGKK